MNKINETILLNSPGKNRLQPKTNAQRYPDNRNKFLLQTYKQFIECVKNTHKDFIKKFCRPFFFHNCPQKNDDILIVIRYKNYQKL